MSDNAHTILVYDALQALAKHGYTAWQNNTGAIKTDTGRYQKYGKVGSADIMGILQPNGRHMELEAKTGTGRQSKEQKIHQQFVVERNGGLYILFRSVDDLLKQLYNVNK